MYVAKSKLVRFIENPVAFLKANEKEVKTVEEDRGAVVCSYGITLTKLYVVLTVWARYMFDAYVSYVRQFSYMNSVEGVPEELKPFYTQVAFDEVKVHCMFKTLILLESKYNLAVHLTVAYLTNVYCTLWWIASRITKNLFTRAIVFHLMTSFCQYRAGDIIFHINLIISSYSVSEGACRVCFWIKDIFKKCFNYVVSMTFVEEVILSILLTMVTTPMCVVLFLAYRLYRIFVLPHVIEESAAFYIKLEQGDLLTMIHKLCQKFNFRVQAVYISRKVSDAHDVKVRGFSEKRYLVLGAKLTEGHVRSDSTALYTKGEIAAVILRAQAEYNVTLPTQDIVIEATRWVTIIFFAVCLSLGLCGGSRLGFQPAPPQIISFIMSKHLSIPILFVVQAVKNNLLRQRHARLDDRVAEVGFGEHLISYIGKESRMNFRCPVEDPFYTMAYSDRPPIIHRIRNIKLKIEPPSS